MDKDIKILGIAGSLRKASFNRAAIRAAGELVPEGATFESFDLLDLPSFNQDREADPPDEVRLLKQKIRESNAILMATPEYNYSFSAVLKNAIDWASRPYGDNAWERKPVAIMGASISTLGTARAQYHLRQVFVFLNMFALNQPEVLIPVANEKFDEGRLVDEETRQRVSGLMVALVEWTRKLEQAGVTAELVPSMK